MLHSAATTILLLLTPAFSEAAATPAPTPTGSERQAISLYSTISLELKADDSYSEAATGASDSANPNPWTHRRLDVYFDHPALANAIRVPGYFAADGRGGSEGRVWRVHFTPQLRGDWIWFANFEAGPLLNAAPPGVAGTELSITESSGRFTVGPLDPNAPGFRSRGVVFAEQGSRYFRYSEPTAGRFVVAGPGSPENFLGYAGFTGASDGRSADGALCCCRQDCFGDCDRTTCASTDDPAPNFLHRYESHEADWRPGDPDWAANGLTQQGRGIIGALNYLGDVGVNSLYIMMMNLGGDGKDTHPFLTDGGGTDCPSPGSGFTPAHTLNYCVRRLDQWRRVFEHAGDQGIMLQLILAEQEACNIRWFGPHDSNGGPRNHMSLYRRLFMKQMVAEFGHLHALRWNLCEENRAPADCQFGSSCGTPGTQTTPQFSAQELDEMGRWIRSWDHLPHPIGVHTVPNNTRIYEDLLALPESPTWLSGTSLQIHGESGQGSEYEAFTRLAGQIFEQAGQVVPIINDEQGSPTSGLSAETNSNAAASSTADDRRRRVLYDLLLSGAQLSYYFGFYSLQEGGGDLRCEDFRTRDQALSEMGFARRLMETVKVWNMEDVDSLLLGPTANDQYGRPEVAAAKDRSSIVVYYPAFRTGPNSEILTAELDLRGQDHLTYGFFWFNPKTGLLVSPIAVRVPGGELTPVPIPDLNGDGIPGNAITPDTDLVLLALSRGFTAAAATE